MQFGWTRRQKPTIGTQIDRTQSLSSGLVWFAPLWEGGGQSIADVIGNVNLATYPTYAPAWSPANTSLLGAGLKCSVSYTGAQATIPSNLKIQAPLTMVIGLRYLGSSAVGVDMISLPLNNTAAPNYIAAGLRVYSAGNLGMITSTSSGNNNVSGITLTTGQDIIIVGVFGTTTYALYGFPVNGAPLPPITGTWATSPSATYTSTALVALGGFSGNASNPSAILYFGGIYNRALSANEASALGMNPWQMFMSPLPFWFGSVSPSVNYAITLDAISASDAGVITIMIYSTESSYEYDNQLTSSSLYQSESFYGTNYQNLSNSLYQYDYFNELEYQIITINLYQYDSSSELEIAYTTTLSASEIFSYDTAFEFEANFVVFTYPQQKTVVPFLLIAPSPPDSFSGAISTKIGSTVGPFIVQPNAPYTGIITPSDGNFDIPNATGFLLLPSPGSVFNPPYLFFNNSTTPQSFTYTPITNGYKPISISGSMASPSAPIFVFVNPNES